MSEPLRIPAVISHKDLMVAIAPLLDLLGVSALDVSNDPPVEVSGDFVSLTVVGAVVTDARAESVTSGHGEWAVEATRVTVPTDIGVAQGVS